MSYDLDLLCPCCGRGSDVNMTFNYAPILRYAFDNEAGIRVLTGKTGIEAIPILISASARIAALIKQVADGKPFDATTAHLKASDLDPCLWGLRQIEAMSQRGLHDKWEVHD